LAQLEKGVNSQKLRGKTAVEDTEWRVSSQRKEKLSGMRNIAKICAKRCAEKGEAKSVQFRSGVPCL
jgi:hypothetical protein